MNFEGLIDFTKYTLALAAGGFIYTLEKFVPMPTAAGRGFVLGVLATFLLSTVAGVVVFSMSTAALHGDAARKARNQKRISPWGIGHAGLLVIGLLALGCLLVPRVLRAPAAPPDPCCCAAALQK